MSEISQNFVFTNQGDFTDLKLKFSRQIRPKPFFFEQYQASKGLAFAYFLGLFWNR